MEPILALPLEIIWKYLCKLAGSHMKKIDEHVFGRNASAWV